MPDLEHFCTVSVSFEMKIIGPTPGGMRADVPFTGVATGPHWEGEWPVQGVDYVTIRSDNNLALDMRATIGEGRDVIAYRGNGISIRLDEKTAEPYELLTFETASEKFSWLNTCIAVGLGRGVGLDLTVDFYLVRR